MEKTLMPEFAKGFRCIGPECEYHCCQEWNIYIDKKTYKKYISAKNPGLKAKALKKIKRDASGTSAAYAIILLEKDTRLCPFLDDDQLCEWQKELGEGYLSEICRNYPRLLFKFDDQYEYTLKASCPEVTRIGIMANEPIRFVTKNSDSSGLYNSIKNFDAKKFRLLRSFMFEILQNRSFYFEHRLILLGMFLQKISQTGYNNLSDTISKYRALFRDPSIIEQFISLPEIPSLQFAVWEKLNQSLDKRISSQRYISLLKDTFQGIGIVEEQEASGFYKNYFNALMKYEKVFTEWEHVFENYFVNDIFAHPFQAAGLNMETNTDNLSLIWDFYIYLCVSYRILKLHFIGIHSLKGKLTDEDVADIVFTYDRAVFGHFKQLITEITDWLKEKDATSLAYMAVLVRT